MRSTTAPVLLLADASVVRHFCEAGVGPALRDYTRGRLFVTMSVKREIKRNAALKRSIESFDRRGSDWPPMLEYDADVEADLARILDARNPTGLGQQREDEGEFSTVLYAESRREETEYLVLMDDHGGKDFAREKNISFVDTPHLAAEMVARGLLLDAVGRRIWRESCSAPQAAFDQAVRAA